MTCTEEKLAQASWEKDLQRWMVRQGTVSADVSKIMRPYLHVRAVVLVDAYFKNK